MPYKSNKRPMSLSGQPFQQDTQGAGNQTLTLIKSQSKNNISEIKRNSTGPNIALMTDMVRAVFLTKGTAHFWLCYVPNGSHVNDRSMDLFALGANIEWQSLWFHSVGYVVLGGVTSP